jgi:hypothetical protein
MSRIEPRLRKLEEMANRRAVPSLSLERRKYLTDRAVYFGDTEALAELNRHRAPSGYRFTNEQRAAAIAASLRSNE